MKNFFVIVLFLIIIPGEAQQKKMPGERYWFDKGKEDIGYNKLKDAVKDYTKIITLNPKDTQAYMLRGLKNIN